MVNMARIKKAPGHYPTIPTFIITFVMAFCSVSVIVTIARFLFYLIKDHQSIPGTFALLLAAGVLTEAFLLGAFFVSCCFPISPIIYLIVHTLLLLLWTVAGILLAVYSSRTLLNDCPSSRWGEAGWGGQLLCRSFKALFAFAFLAWLSLLAAISLDIRACRKQGNRGAYSKMQDLDHKRGVTPHDDPWSTEMGPTAAAPSPAPHANTAFTQPQGGYGPVGETHAPEPAHAAPAQYTAYTEQQPLHPPARSRSPSISPAPSIAPSSVPTISPPNYDTSYRGSGELFYDAPKK